MPHSRQVDGGGVGGEGAGVRWTSELAWYRVEFPGSSVAFLGDGVRGEFIVPV